MTQDEIAELVTEGSTLRAEIEVSNARLKEINAALIAQGSGKYADPDGNEANVIIPGPGVKPTQEDIDEVRQITGDDLFKKLFERVVSFKAVKSFAEVAKALLTPAKLRRVTELVTKESTPYVKWK